MANKLQQDAFRRRVIYGVTIFALFGLSMFWRGKLAVPFSGQVGASRWFSERSVLAQAEKLELRELDQGDPEIAGETARLALDAYARRSNRPAAPMPPPMHIVTMA